MILSFPHKPLIGAHRGASEYAPENTLAAFDLAAIQGAELIELDVHLSADGYLVVHHDFDLRRTAGHPAMVGDLDLAVLRMLDVGSWKSTRFVGERIPTLEAVFEQLGQRVLLNVEIKVDASSSDRIDDIVASTIRSHGLADRVVVSTFDVETFMRLRRGNPDIRASLLFESPVADPATAPPVDVLGPTLTVAAEFGAVGVHLEHTLVTPGVVERASELGLGVLAWTVDDEREMRDLALAGVEAILSNRPDALRQQMLPFRTGQSG